MYAVTVSEVEVYRSKDAGDAFGHAAKLLRREGSDASKGLLYRAVAQHAADNLRSATRADLPYLTSLDGVEVCVAEVRDPDVLTLNKIGDIASNYQPEDTADALAAIRGLLVTDEVLSRVMDIADEALPENETYIALRALLVYGESSER